MSNPTETNYRHPFPNYQLGDLTQAMDYNNLGQPILRVGVNYGTNVTGPGNTNGQIDAFGRMRVSEPYTLFDTKARYYDHNQFSNSTSGSQTITYNAASSTYTLTVGTANGDSITRETKRVFPYQPGKSLLVLNTFCMQPPKANLTQRVGYYGRENGVYFEANGTTYNMVLRSSSSGTLSEKRVPQTSWNVDTLNGSGTSNISLNADTTNIFYTDLEWLGVGSVRTGFIINGQFVIAHIFNHANQAGNTNTYMSTATLPIRYEIFNSGSTTGNSTMRQICSTVMSEGGYNSFSITETAGTGIITKRLTTGNTYYPMVSIRLDSTRLDSVVLPRQVDILSPSVNYYRWTLLLNPNLTNANFAGSSSTGSVDFDTNATAVSGGTELQSGYISSRELNELGADAFTFQLGRTLANVSDIVTLALTATSNNADVLAQLGWQEIT
jgi:hypothetical protein